MNAQIYQFPRSQPRDEVQWAATATIGTSAIASGMILDYSLDGLFFAPEDVYVDGTMGAASEVDGDFARVGDRVVVQSQGRTLEIGVRWVGWSQAHRCYGFGGQTLALSRRVAA